MSQVILPKVPSELLTIALRDLKKTIKAGITIDMFTWGKNIGTPECTVCFAGAVMLQTENQNPDVDLDFTHQGVNQDQYVFLDNIREGYLISGLNCLGIKTRCKYDKFVNKIEDWLRYDECSNEVFFKQIEDLIVYLKSKGI